MKRFSKISIDDIKTIQVDSGVLLKEFDVENPVFLPENVICATSGGINPVCAPEYYDFGEDVDNAKSAKETKRIRGWNASISFTTFTTSLDLIRLALGAADVSGKVLSIRQKLQYAKDFSDIWWVGKRADDKLLAIRLIRSLSDSGFSLQTTKRGKGQISITLKGHSSFTDKNKIPMEMYVIEDSNEPVIPDVPESAMYLYGTPSETGNIGLRVGESVTRYEGCVAANIDEVYTDELKAEYGAAVIALEEDTGECYLLLYLDYGAYFPRVDDTGSISTMYVKGCFKSVDGQWIEASKPSLSKAIWSNVDVIYGDGIAVDEDVYLYASDPIPVSGLVGYSYGGVLGAKMPELPEGYPYVAVMQTGGLLYAHALTEQMTINKNGSLCSADGVSSSKKFYTRQCQLKSYSQTIEQPEWGDAYGINLISGTLVMANYTVYSTDGSLYQAASNAIPVYE